VAYLLAGVLSGLLPVLIGSTLEARGPHAFRLMSAIEEVLVFLLVLVPHTCCCAAVSSPSHSSRWDLLL
jgi:hypothetical protein